MFEFSLFFSSFKKVTTYGKLEAKQNKGSFLKLTVGPIKEIVSGLLEWKKEKKIMDSNKRDFL